MPKSTGGAAKAKSDSNNPKQRIFTPILLQMHASECGAACLGSVLGYFGRWATLSELREKCEVSRDGCSAGSISRAARQFGLECKGISVRSHQLKMLELPLILFWQFSHFVVLEGYDEENYYLNDPSSGRRVISAEEFDKSYSSIALRFNRTDEFKPGGEPPGLFSRLNDLIVGNWNVLAGIMICGLMLALLMLLIPYTLRYFVDSAGITKIHWQGLAAGLLGGGVLVYTLALLKNRFLKRLEIRISISNFSETLLRLLRLPVEFFEHRLGGDLIDRVSSIDRISKNLTEQFLVLLIDMAMSAVFLIVMFTYDILLSVIVLLLAALHTISVHFLNSKRAVLTHSMRREQGLLIGLGIQMLNHAENLRMTGADDRYFSRWCGQQARELRARSSYAELSAVNSSLPGVISLFSSAAIIGVGGSQVLAGSMTLGTLVGFFILTQMFLVPVGRFMEFTDQRQALETDLHRIDDISKTEIDPIFTRRKSDSGSIATFNGRLQLAGQLELRDVNFGFNKSRPPLVKDFNMSVKPGQRIALVGSSGSGKSTISRLISGLYSPWSGEILFDNHLRDDIPEEVIRQSVSMVDQEILLFSGTIRDNITLWNSAVPDETVFAAARDAQIHDDILQRPQGYSTMVEEGGTNFSGGQRQRLEIARALVNNPTILILDEATSSLDAATEAYVDEALRRRGITCVIVAHRLSTVRDCDEIIVMHHGETTQRGVHDDLMDETDGLYHKLVPFR